MRQRIIMERFKARLIDADGCEFGYSEWEHDDGLFVVFLTIHGSSRIQREFVGACKRACYCPPLMLAVLESWMSACSTQRLAREIVRLRA
jgi:hypothetical protein